MEHFDLILVELHEPGQSRMNSELWADSYRVFYKGTTASFSMKAYKEDRINSPQDPCFEDEAYSTTDCVDAYIEDQLGCNLPWLAKNESKQSYMFSIY